MAVMRGCVPPVKILKMVKMAWTCGWSVGLYPHENGEMVKTVKTVKIVWACGWDGR